MNLGDHHSAHSSWCCLLPQFSDGMTGAAELLLGSAAAAQGSTQAPAPGWVLPRPGPPLLLVIVPGAGGLSCPQAVCAHVSCLCPDFESHPCSCQSAAPGQTLALDSEHLVERHSPAQGPGETFPFT